MTLEILILTTAVLFGILAISFAWLFHRNSKQNRCLIEFLGKQVEDLEEALTDSRQKLEAGSRRVSDQACRVAWLESRVRQPRLLKEKAEVEKVLDATPLPTSKSSMTERRHRVLSLASRGQDARKIASTLGMLPGEVELIINLNRVTV